MLTIRNMTIRNKLISIIMAVCIVALFLAGTAFIIWQWFSIRRTMVHTLSTQARIIADNSEAALSFKDSGDAEGILQALKAEPSIVFGGIYTEEGEIFAGYYRDDSQLSQVRPSKLQESGYSFNKDFLTVFEPIVVGEEKTGRVCVRSDLVPLYTMLKHNVGIMFVVLLLASSVAYFMSSGLQKIISKPVLDLADVARTVSEKKEYSVRAIKHSSDEIGFLIDAFNEMLNQIHKRDLALVNANGQLEKKVEERTYELKDEVAVRRKAEEALAEAVKKLTMSNKELREFTRVAAHDLKTPVQGIGVLSGWIAEDYADKFGEEGQEKARLLTVRAKRMNNLLDSIIQYSQLTINGCESEKLDLNVLLRDVIESMNPPDDIEIIIESKLPTIWAARRYVCQIFENLLSNAIRYIDKPEGKISIGCAEEGNCWRFSVADNGLGIEERYFEKIFKIFQILSTRDETESIGIGLPIVKKIVEMYDGRIWVESTPGLGSTFFFTLPREQRKEPEYVTAEFQSNIIS
jgi:signal transduction histidine kinase